MSDKLPDVWSARDFPVLRGAVRAIDENGRFVSSQELAATTGLDRHDVNRALVALERRRLVTLLREIGTEDVEVDDVSGEAYILTGLHPDGDDIVDRLVSALRQAADRTDDPDERSRLRRLADGAAGMSRDVAVAVASAFTISALGAS